MRAFPVIIMALLFVPFGAGPADATHTDPCYLKHYETRSGSAWYAVKFSVVAGDRVGFLLTGRADDTLGVTSWLTYGTQTPAGPAYASMREDASWHGSSIDVAGNRVDVTASSSVTNDAFTWYIMYTFLGAGTFTAVHLAAADVVSTSTLQYCTTTNAEPVGTSSGSDAAVYTEKDFAGLIGARTDRFGPYLTYTRDAGREEAAVAGQGMFAAFLGFGDSVSRDLRIDSPTASVSAATSYAVHNSPHAWRFIIREHLELAPSNADPSAGHVLLTVARVTMP